MESARYFYIRNEENHPVCLVGRLSRVGRDVLYAFATCNADEDTFDREEAHARVDKRLRSVATASEHGRSVEGHFVRNCEELSREEAVLLDASGVKMPTIVEAIVIDIAKKGRLDVPSRVKKAARSWLKSRFSDS